MTAHRKSSLSERRRVDIVMPSSAITYPTISSATRKLLPPTMNQAIARVDRWNLCRSSQSCKGDHLNVQTRSRHHHNVYSPRDERLSQTTLATRTSVSRCILPSICRPQDWPMCWPRAWLAASGVRNAQSLRLYLTSHADVPTRHYL